MTTIILHNARSHVGKLYRSMISMHNCFNVSNIRQALKRNYDLVHGGLLHKLCLAKTQRVQTGLLALSYEDICLNKSPVLVFSFVLIYIIFVYVCCHEIYVHFYLMSLGK